MIRRALVPVALILVLAGGLAYQVWVVPTRFAVDIGAGMLAKQICSCIFVARRGVEDCRADQSASADPIQVETSDAGVRAFVPLFGERVAVFREGLGCTLE